MAIKKTTKKKPVLRSKKNGARKLKRPDYTSFKLSKRMKHPGPRLSGSIALTKASIVHILRNKKIFVGISLSYLLLNVVLVRGFVITSDLGTAKEAFGELFVGAGGEFSGAVAVFGLLVSSTTPTNQVAAMYQSLITILFSLFLIWALRQTYAKEMISLKDVFYRSTYPLIQFLIVLLVVTVQLLPIVIANFIYGFTVSSGFSESPSAVFAWTSLVFLLFLWSFYMVSSSIFALYIVTLPGMTPFSALRAAKKLVSLRRWTVMRKVLFVPLALLLAGMIILLPILLFFTGIASAVFLILSAFVLAVTHGYMYALYRELLDE